MFEFEVDQSRLFLRIKLVGYWESTIWQQYKPAVQAAFEALEPMGGCRAMLIDLSVYPIQTQEIATAHQRVLETTRRTQPTRIAILAQSSLSKLQARRVAGNTGHSIFDTESAAMEWLFPTA